MVLLCFRKLQLREDEWVRRMTPVHESMLHMQEDDLAHPLEGFARSAQEYLAFYYAADATHGDKEYPRDVLLRHVS